MTSTMISISTRTTKNRRCYYQKMGIFLGRQKRKRKKKVCLVYFKIKRRLLLGRKAMTNLESILKSRDITLPTKVHIIKIMVFPLVMYRYERWTIKKAEHERIDASELWCWRRLLRVPWTARRSNQSILKEIFATPWTVAYKAPLSVEFSRQEYWSGVPLPSPTSVLLK